MRRGVEDAKCPPPETILTGTLVERQAVAPRSRSAHERRQKIGPNWQAYLRGDVGDLLDNAGLDTEVSASLTAMVSDFRQEGMSAWDRGEPADAIQTSSHAGHYGLRSQ